MAQRQLSLRMLFWLVFAFAASLALLRVSSSNSVFQLLGLAMLAACVIAPLGFLVADRRGAIVGTVSVWIILLVMLLKS